MTEPLDRLLDAALLHVPFDGWSPATFRQATADAGLERAQAEMLASRGAVDLAVAFHKRGDTEMTTRMRTEDLSALKYREKVAAAVRFRLEAVPDKELVRRGMTLFSLPTLAPEGAKLLWATADAIWEALGDTSDDINWYTKRATLSGVYSTTVLFWLGDDSPGHQATWAFLDRRIENVMQIEKAKTAVNNNAVLRTLFAGPIWAASKVRKPMRFDPDSLPGIWRPTPTD